MIYDVSVRCPAIFRQRKEIQIRDIGSIISYIKMILLNDRSNEE